MLIYDGFVAYAWWPERERARSAPLLDRLPDRDREPGFRDPFFLELRSVVRLIEQSVSTG